MIRKIILAVIFLIGLAYLLAPAPKNIYYFPPLPNSLKSTQSGDTIQIPNVEAFYSDNRRAYATAYYKNFFDHLSIFGIVIPSLKINRPPEEAFQYIRDQQSSTYLEEYFYPFRESLFVNGFEPIDDQGHLRPHLPDTTKVGDKIYQSKVTLRYYPSSPIIRVLVYLGVWVSVFFLFKLGRQILREKL